MPFKPGQSGNPEGKQPGKIWIAALNRSIAQDDGKRLRAAAEKLLDLAAEGNVPALKELGDRLDGRAAQAIELSSDPNAPLKIIHESV
jgi:hypothetical protein